MNIFCEKGIQWYLEFVSKIFAAGEIKGQKEFVKINKQLVAKFEAPSVVRVVHCGVVRCVLMLREETASEGSCTLLAGHYDLASKCIVLTLTSARFA